MTGTRSMLLRAEVALGLVTLAAVIGMGRLFDSGDWIVPLVLNAVAAHVVVALCRRRGLSLAASAGASVVAAAFAITWTTHLSTTTLGIPTRGTWSAMGDDLSEAWLVYQEVLAPAPALTGFILASAAVIWGVAYVADWAAFRLWVPFEATLAAGTLFLFTAMLGVDDGRAPAIALFAGAVIGFMLIHRMARQDGTSHWVADRRERGQRWLLGAGGGLAAVAVLLGTILGPNLPGAGSTGFIDPAALRGDDTRITVSPLVDIRTRLVQQSALEVFQVRSPEPAYWRLTSLDRFDGRIWRSSGSYSDAGGTLPDTFDEMVASSTFEQTFVISALAQIWLPNAYEPRAISIEGAEVRYDPGSATLIVDRDFETSDGLVYTVTSRSPRITAADLSGEAGEVPAEIRERFTQLDDDFSERVRQLAQDITAGASTPYEQALALQDHLRTFRYTLTANAGHSDDHLEQFLFETQEGYCEQFAGSFAAMARSIGLPARVAVGFTQGDQDPNDPALYIVRGEHAHAWPEVFLAGAGWVAFEPTPGRGMPFAEDYTGVQPAQAAAGNPEESVPGPTTTAPSTPSGPTPTLPDTGGSVPDNVEQPSVSDPTEPEAEVSNLERWLLRPLRWVLVVVALAALVYAVIFPAGLWWSRRRRRRAAGQPHERIALAWTEAQEALAVLGHQSNPWDTPAEVAGTMGAVVDDAAVSDSLSRLARLVEESSYSEEGADELAAELAEEAVEPIQAAVRERASTKERLRPWLDPRPQIRRRRRDMRARQRRITGVVRDGSHEEDLVGAGDRP